jgi:hypothetical protein
MEYLMSPSDAVRVKFEHLRDLMNERIRRRWAATEASVLGWGGVGIVADATGLSRKTINVGMRELNGPLANPQIGTSAATQPRIRRPGGGNKLAEVKDSTLLAHLEEMLKDEVAGDPMSCQRWIRSSTRHLSRMLIAQGHRASPSTVSRLLKKMGFSLKGNKRKEFKADSPDRDQQFHYIASQRHAFIQARLPVISVDTKKKELIGDFRNAGRAWCKKPPNVNEHDFPTSGHCRAVPFGIYDVTRNEGYVYVNMSSDTPEAAVEAIARWWRQEGPGSYPAANHLLILADSGGSNGCRARGWKHNIQMKLCDELRLTVTVCHYPTSGSKWNPVEHRLFSYVSINWAGKPLRTLDTMLEYIRNTTTMAGLKVQSFALDGHYPKGRKVTQANMNALMLSPHDVCPKWNYTLRPGNTTSNTSEPAVD